MNDSNELQQPLTSSTESFGGDDTASQGSQRSRTSLLDRIRAKQSQQQQPSSSAAAPTSTIQVPQYNPVAQEENFAGGGPAPPQPPADTSSFFSSAWNNISESMETGMASLQQEDSRAADQALLAPSSYHEENYSMTEYFMTFVNDVYTSFLSLPLLVRATMIFALLFTAFKLM